MITRNLTIEQQHEFVLTLLQELYPEFTITSIHPGDINFHNPEDADGNGELSVTINYRYHLDPAKDTGRPRHDGSFYGKLSGG